MNQAVNKSRSGGRRRAMVGVIAGALVLAMAPQAFAQGAASSDEPAVLERNSRGESGQVRPAQGQQDQSQGQRQEQSWQEQFNLPPNFDPGFRARRTPANTRVTIDFRQSSLEDVVKFFSGAMNINFIIADSLQANKTITIMAPEEITLAEGYRAFLAALSMNGLTVVPMGNFLKIVESGAAISEPQRAYEGGDVIPNESRMVTAIVPVERAEVGEIQEVISNFLSSSASVVPYGSSLIITENAANLRRIQSMVERLDQGEGASNLYVYRVLHADATEVSERLKEIFDSGDGGGSSAQPQTAAQRRAAARARRASPNQGAEESASAESGTLDVQITEIIADERTNQLIIVSNERSFQRIREMIEILDVPTAVGGQVHVKFLEYASAEELSQTLSQLASGVQSQQNQRGGQAQRQPAADAATVGSILQGEVQITAYQPTNALVVVASPRDYVALERVIDQLDAPRRQVYVEAVIMEIGVDVDRQLEVGATSGLARDLGFLIPDQALASGAIESTQGFGLGSSNFGGLGELTEGGAGASLSLLGPILTVPGTAISLPAFALLLQASQSDNSINVLSTPSILTMDNEEAEIEVGDRIPIPRSAGVGGGLGSILGLGGLAGGAASGLSSALGGLGGAAGLLGGLGGGFLPQFDYEDIGIMLRIVPQINESDYVRLEVNQEVSDLKGAGGLTDGAPPTRTLRNISTTVLVRDQSTIVIGGLMRDVENETINKVPFLGDIPVVGLLFRNTSTRTTKQNLVLMLTPYIIEGEEDMQKIYERKMEERRELMRLFANRNMEYMATVNFQKKSGLVERMRRRLDSAVTQEEARQQVLEQFEDQGPRFRILGGSEAESAAPAEGTQTPAEGGEAPVDAQPAGEE
ncbi:type II secretion system protein GspD [Lujinxingia sediminis]|uniref:Type II secretion system protein GspD n=1 Tax=Lujinxingia sediminis TaxID=2480984 RepID=A0ABY0CU86_9DELT|nr:type II secretion system secretin GspD [Lujinxingia sediminis]RVU44899.1 type II secretion system protein GspD [Lujinxingia sediminis]